MGAVERHLEVPRTARYWVLGEDVAEPREVWFVLHGYKQLARRFRPRLARRADGQSQILSVKSQVYEGDVVATAENSYARLKFGDGTEVVLRPSTQLKVNTFRYTAQRPAEDNVFLALLKGGFRSVTGLLAKRNPANFRVQAPNATIGIRGTNFGALYCANDCGGVPGPRSGALS